MNNNKPVIHHITFDERQEFKAQERQLIEQVAVIEGLIQPTDSWQYQAIIDLLSQKVNHCWVILNPNPREKETDKNNDRYKEASRNKIVAYCILSKVFEVVDILRIGTHPDYQRSGLATELLQAVIDSMASNKVDRIILEVRADNQAAINLYQKLGFVEIHRRRNYYTTKADQTDVETGTATVTPKDKGATLCDAIIMQYARLG